MALPLADIGHGRVAARDGRGAAAAAGRRAWRPGTCPRAAATTPPTPRWGWRVTARASGCSRRPRCCWRCSPRRPRSCSTSSCATRRGSPRCQITLFSILTNTPGGIGLVIGGRLADTRGRRGGRGLRRGGGHAAHRRDGAARRLAHVGPVDRGRRRPGRWSCPRSGCTAPSCSPPRCAGAPTGSSPSSG